MTDESRERLTQAALAALENARLHDEAMTKERIAAILQEQIQKKIQEKELLLLNDEERALLLLFRKWRATTTKTGAMFRYQVGEPLPVVLPLLPQKILDARNALVLLYEDQSMPRDRIRAILADLRDDLSTKILCLWDEMPVETLLGEED